MAYVPTGNPFPSAPALSAIMRAEFQRIKTAIDAITLPPTPPPDSVGKTLVVNQFSNAYELTDGALVLTGDFSLIGAHTLTISAGYDVTLTAPYVDGQIALTRDIYVENIAALEALPENQRPGLVCVLGYYAAGDGGGGDFRWDVNSATSANGGTVIAPSSLPTGRYKRVYPGNLIYARWFGATGNVGDNQTAAINNAIAVINTDGGELRFEYGYYSYNSLNAVTKSGAVVSGIGPNSTFMVHMDTSGNGWTMSGSFQAMRNITFNPFVWKTTGYELDITGAYRTIVDNCLFQYHNDGIKITRVATPTIRGCTFLYSHGTANIDFRASTLADAAFGLVLEDLVFNNPAPYTPEGAYRAFGTSTPFTAGEYTYSNNWIWQCTSSGTTAGAGVLTVDSSNSTNWLTISVAHGGAEFRALARVNQTHVRHGSYAYSIEGKGVRFLAGGISLYMDNDVGIAGSVPYWNVWDNLESDHAFFAGISAVAGSGITLGSNCWIGATLNGPGISTATSFLGPLYVIGVRIASSAHSGISFLAGSNLVVADCVFSDNGNQIVGSFNDISIGAGISHFKIHDNTFGSEGSVALNTVGYGCFIAVGASDYYSVHDNTGFGVINSTIFDGGTGTNARVVDNIGYNPVTTSELVVGASPFTYTTGHAPETIIVNGGTVDPIIIDGLTIFEATDKAFTLPANKSMTVTYTVIPAIFKIPH